MFIIMPFPRCPSCGKMEKNAIHRICGTFLEIDPKSEIVHCPSCDTYWSLNESHFFCGECGRRFDASEIRDATEELLMICKICVDSLIAQANARNERERFTSKSIEKMVFSALESLGDVLGFAIGTVIASLKKLFF